MSTSSRKNYEWLIRSCQSVPADPYFRGAPVTSRPLPVQSMRQS